MKQDIERAAAGIRKRVLAHTIKNNGGYMSQACSSAETLVALYLGIMKLPKIERPLQPGKFPGVPGPFNSTYATGTAFNGGHRTGHDRFYLSPAHYALALYAVLIESGRMSQDGLDYFNVDGSSVEMIGAEHSPGMEVTTGSLGQGISQAAGNALARKLKSDNGINYVYLSDGEFEIGQTWEAFQAAGHYKLDNLVIFADMNGQQCDGTVASVMTVEPVAARLKAFGAVVVEIDGHDIDALLNSAKTPHQDKVLAVLCKTDPCRSLDLLRANYPKLHYLRFKSESERHSYAQVLHDQFGGEV